MHGDPIENTKETQTPNSSGASDALRNEYIKDGTAGSGKQSAKSVPDISDGTGVSKGTATPDGSAPKNPPTGIEANTNKSAPADGQTVAPMSLAEQRRQNEQHEFQQRFNKHNFTLPPMQKGWGPFQALSSMAKNHQIDMTPDEVVKTSRQIRDRDFNDFGRKYYTASDTTSLYSQPQMDAMVAKAVSQPKGIDVSHYDGVVDWSKVKEAGYQFTFIKATEGITVVDAQLAANQKGAAAAGLQMGYYHYFHPEDAVDKQVDNFVKAIGKQGGASLRLVVDLEDPSLWAKYSTAQRVQMVDQWCQQVAKATGAVPSVMVYGSPSFFSDTLATPTQLGKYPLWIADYEVATPKVPKPWTSWNYWQYSETGTVAGINSKVDLDVYNGDTLPK